MIGPTRLEDPQAFEVYRIQVGATVRRYGGRIVARGRTMDLTAFGIDLAPQPAATRPAESL